MVLLKSKDNFWLIKSSLTERDLPDYNRYNNKIARLTGQSMKPRTNTVYMQLIIKLAADSLIILNAMSEITTVTRDG